MAHSWVKLTGQNTGTQQIRPMGRKPQIYVKRLHGSQSCFPIVWAHCPADFNSTFSHRRADGVQAIKA
jgi:hypothetical protein